MSQLTLSLCPACKSEKITQTLKAEDYTVSHEVFEIWTCNTCGLRFTQQIPDESSIGKYYQSEDYISHSDTQKGLVNRLYHIVRNITLSQKRKLLGRITGLQSGKLLDIGCGTGAFLSVMKKAGWEVSGLEPDPGARDHAKRLHGLDIEEPEKLFAMEAGGFDAITMWHVLEHVHRLHPYLETVHKLLRPGGSLLIAVPNFQSLDATEYGEFWAAYDVPRHLYHFSPDSMRSLLEQKGFSLSQMKLMPFDSFYVSLLSERYQHGKTRLLQGFFTGLRSWIQATSKPENGSSIIYIALKNKA
jgi:2-polyprenyl-3-methyl-5-hydroxy-6-metoxy-1,4-benzoquinol methylase